MLKKSKKYKSEISNFLLDLQSDIPELEKKQKVGRSLLWDRPNRVDDNNETIKGTRLFFKKRHPTVTKWLKID